MDWFLLTAFLLVLLIIGVAGIFAWSRLVTETKQEFHQHQPALRVTNLSAMDTGEVLTLTPEVENVGRGVALDCVVQLAGWEGRFEARRIYPQGPRYRRHAVPIVLDQDAPIRTRLMSRCYLRLAYRDRWEQRYECWYPVTQIKNVKTSFYDIDVDLTHPELTEPHPSFRTMWQLVRSTPAND
ncbi:MAG: hypothetical protein A4E19_17895 [Nitrospira sp. SG-bin1]|nr:MAG: hypothetical protein A4E19_17895 [Nitrospira sp. SG-bin1]